jgi:hypothetical protein
MPGNSSSRSAVIGLWIVVPSTAACLALAWLMWCRAVADDWVAWRQYSAYLHRFRPGTCWTWSLDPSGLGLLSFVAVGLAMLVLRAGRRLHGAWAVLSWLAATWYIGCASYLLFRPLGQ